MTMFDFKPIQVLFPCYIVLQNGRSTETVAAKSRSDARKGGGGAHFREKIVEVRWQVGFVWKYGTSKSIGESSFPLLKVPIIGGYTPFSDIPKWIFFGWQVCSDFCQSMWTRWAANWHVHTMAIITRHCDYAQICSSHSCRQWVIRSLVACRGNSATLSSRLYHLRAIFRSLTSPKKRIASRSQMLPHGNDTMI